MPAPTLLDLDRELVTFFAAGEARDDATFNALALRVFAAQFDAIAGYRAFCQKRGVLPARLRHWTEIPAVPVQAFRDVRLVSDDAGPPARVFRTSGTTGSRPGEHYMTATALALYEASLTASFRAFVLPETAEGARSALLPLALLPPPGEAPHSSLVSMVETVGEELFAEPVRWLLREGVLDAAAFERAAAEAKRARHGVCVLTTDLALDRLLTALEAKGARLGLPSGSRVMHTGGSKGLRVELDPNALVARVEACLGVPPAACVNEYGMTELCSQFYDDALISGAAPPLPRPLRGPAWTRTLVVDPHTLDPLPAGRPGLLRIWDLANRGSVMCIQTEDRAEIDVPTNEFETPSRATLAALGTAPFRLLGRARGSEPRGCSLEAEVPVA